MAARFRGRDGDGEDKVAEVMGRPAVKATKAFQCRSRSASGIRPKSPGASAAA